MNWKKPALNWLPFLFLAWTLVLLGSSHRASLVIVPENWDFLTDIAIPRLAIGGNFFQFWSHHLVLLAECISFLIGAWGIGRFLLARFHTSERRNAPDWTLRLVLLPTAFGLGVMGYAAFAILSLGFLARAVLQILALAAAIHGSVRLVREVRGFRLGQNSPSGGPDPEDKDHLPALLAVCIVAALGVDLILSTVPEINYDALEYHLAVPHAYLQAGRIIDLPYNCFSKLPLLMSMVYVWALAAGGTLLDGMYIAKWINFFLGIGVTVAVYSWGKTLRGPRTGLLAAMVFSCLPMVTYFYMVATADMACVFFVFMSGSAFLLWARERKEISLLWISGLLGGFALATKYVACFGLAPLWLWLVYERWLKKPRSAAAMTQFTCLLLVPLLPWWTQNLVLGYNPLFPVIGGPSLGDPRSVTYIAGSVAEVLKYSLIYSPNPGLMIGPLFLAAAPLLAWGARERGVRLGLLYCLIGISGGFLATLHFRFFAQFFPVAAVLLALSVAQLENELTRFSTLLCHVGLLSICALNLGWSAAILMFSRTEGLLVGTGQMTPSEFLKVPRDLYPAPSFGAYEALEALQLPGKKRVLVVGDARTYYCPLPHIGNSSFDRSPILDWAEKARTPEELVARIDMEDIRAIVFNRAEFYRVALGGKHNKPVEDILNATFRRFFETYYEDVFNVVLLRNSSARGGTDGNSASPAENTNASTGR